MKKVLIISGSYPNYGGEATTAYSLLKLLRIHNFHTIGVFVNNDNNYNTDPDNTGCSYNIAVTPRTFIHKLYSLLKRRRRVSSNIQQAYQSNAVPRSLYYNARLLPKIMLLLFSKRFLPDIIISFNPIYYTVLSSIFSPHKIITIAAGSPEMSLLCKKEIDAVFVMQNPAIATNTTKEINHYPYEKMNVIFNSPLTYQLYRSLGLNPKVAVTQYFNISDNVLPVYKSFNDRNYSISFVCSNFNRHVKNTLLAKNIFEQFQPLSKLAIGLNSNLFQNINNCNTIDLSTQNEVASYLADCKVLIITSYFDSSPGVLSEAILSGCNVLVSKNVGWHDMLDERCVVQNYNDVNEWKEKAAYLMQHKIDYSRFEEVIASSTASIIANIQSVLDK